MFYVYCLYRPWDMTPCYVGKGKGKRVHHHARMGDKHPNKRLARTIKKAGGKLPFDILFESENEQAVFAEEIRLIKQIGRANIKTGPLCNLTDGGEGQSGWVPSPETRAKIGASHVGRTASAETRLKMSIAGKGKIRTPEAIEQGRLKMIGKKASSATIEKMKKRHARDREKTRARAFAQHAAMTEEQRAERSRKISIATKAAMKDPEILRKIASGHKGISPSEEMREKNRQGQYRRWDKIRADREKLKAEA